MYLQIDRASGIRQLVDADAFDAFKVVVGGVADEVEAVAVAAAGLGCQPGDGSVFVPRDVVRDLAGARAEDAGWRAGFEAMLEYASAKGWLDEHGAIQAHVEAS